MSTEHIGITSPSLTRRWNLDIQCIVFFATRVINENQKIHWHCIINANIARSVASKFVCIGGGKGAEKIIFLVDLHFRGRGDARTSIYLFRLYALHVVSSQCLAGNTRYCALPNANPNCQMANGIRNANSWFLDFGDVLFHIFFSTSNFSLAAGACALSSINPAHRCVPIAWDK